MSAAPAPHPGIRSRAAAQVPGRFAWLAPFLFAALAFATLGFAARRQPLGGDDVYVLENLRSGVWSRRLFAFNVDAPTTDHFAWWTGEVFQRRYVRVPASALLWLEWEIFGRRAVPYHVVTLVLVVATCWLIYGLARRYLPAAPALGIALVPASHPAASEVVGSLSCQPIATAGLFSVATVVSWERMRRSRSPAAFALALPCCGLAMTSYEAAIVLPFALVLADDALSKQYGQVGARARRLGLLAVFVAYVPLEVAVRRGLQSPDSGPLRPFDQVWRSARLDATAYWLKAFGIFDPRDPSVYWLHRAAGEPFAIVTALLLLVAVILLVRRHATGLLGLAVFGLFLLAPWLTRATVSQLNLPALRQLYLPVLLGAPLVAAAMWSRARAQALLRGGATASIIALAGLAVLSSGMQTGFTRAWQLASSLRAVMAEIPRDRTVVGIGANLCGQSPSLVASNPSIFAIPTSVDGTTPALIPLDAHALLVRAPESELDVVAEEQQPVGSAVDDRGPVWVVQRPPPLVALGAQRIPGGAALSIAERGPRGIRAIRYDFDRPLSQLTFLRLRGCEPPERVDLGPLAQ